MEKHQHQSSSQLHDQEQTQNILAMPGVKNVVAIASGKGGVGKSTVTTHLAYALKEAGHKVAVLDADIYGPSQAMMMGADYEKDPVYTGENGKLVPVTKHGVKFISMASIVADEAPVVWRAPMAVKAIDQFLSQTDWGELDYLLVDLPPGTGDIQLTLAQKTYLTGAIIVTTPQHVAVGVAKKGLRMFKDLKVPILGIIENMRGYICTDCKKENFIFGSGGGERLAAELKISYLGGVPIDSSITESGDKGKPVFLTRKDSPAVACFQQMAAKLGGLIVKVEGQGEFFPSQVSLAENGNLAITWLDGKKDIFSAHYLRSVCPCAQCVDEDTGKRILDANTIPLDIKVMRHTFVGRYGLSLAFSDHHGTGIYQYTDLKKIAAEFKESGSCQEFSV